MIQIHYKEKRDTSMKQGLSGGVPYLYWDRFESTGLVRHGFSTRIGGISQGYYASMNLGMKTGDDRELIRENFRRIGDALGIPAEHIVSTQQTHTTNVLKVTEENRGNGIFTLSPYTDVDGLITDCLGVALSVFGADCVPLFFLDPVHRAIGTAHSGWRGTAGQIGAVTIEKMGEEFGTKARDILCGIGPSICADCYEVSEDVIEQFREVFDPDILATFVLPGKRPGKYQLDLWEANRQILLLSGVPAEHIFISDICTCCNPDLLFSHRRLGTKRGNNGGFLMLR